MKWLICLLLVTLVFSKAGDCVTAYCGPLVKECREQQCDSHVAKCANGFKKGVGSAQKTGLYKGTNHALDDFNYCMSTNSVSKKLNACRQQYCSKMMFFKDNDVCVFHFKEHYQYIINEDLSFLSFQFLLLSLKTTVFKSNAPMKYQPAKKIKHEHVAGCSIQKLTNMQQGGKDQGRVQRAKDAYHLCLKHAKLPKASSLYSCKMSKCPNS